jgi:serine/threonine protein kinase
VYPDSPCFSIPNVLSYARGVAAAAHHLHSRGILHGDLYGHNILVSEDRALVSDFGAACIYQGNSLLDSAMLERIEVHAYGILLHELLAHVTTSSSPQHGKKLAALQQLADHCCSMNVAARPGFSEILSSCSES